MPRAAIVVACRRSLPFRFAPREPAPGFTINLESPPVMSHKITTLRQLLVDELKDLYSAETQLTKALPKMAKAAQHEELKEGFEFHLGQTNEQIERLERIFQLLGEKPKGKTCEAMKGLIAEGEEWINQDGTPALKDAGLIVCAQKVEHYEIAGYGSARAFAEILGQTEVADLLQATLDEERDTDETLTEITATLGLGDQAADDEISDESGPAGRHAESASGRTQQ